MSARGSRRVCVGLSVCLGLLPACDAAVVGRLAGDAAAACGEELGDAASGVERALAYGGASAATVEFSEGRVHGGRQFEVTEDCVYVVELGVWDHRQDGLSRAHAVALFALDRAGAGASAVLVDGASAEVQPGSDVAIDDGFRLAVLPRPVLLARGVYAVVAYDFSSEEPYGQGGSLPMEGTGLRDLGYSPLESSPDMSLHYPAGGDGGSHVTASLRTVRLGI